MHSETRLVVQRGDEPDAYVNDNGEAVIVLADGNNRTALMVTVFPEHVAWLRRLVAHVSEVVDEIDAAKVVSS